MKPIKLSASSSIPLTDIQRCASEAQAIFIRDTVAQKVVARIGQDIINQGLVLVEDCAKDHVVNIFANLYVIPPEYGNDVLRFAQDVVEAHAAKQALDAPG